MGLAWKVSPEVERYDDALDWFGKRVVMTGAAARKLDDATKRDAFWVGGGLQITQVQRVFDELKASLEKGESFADFKKRVAGELRDPRHVETVFRNATQRAYNAGRWEQMREESVRKYRPFWLFDALLDPRTTDVCTLCNGTLLPHDHPWWKTHVPPLHHRCRSSLRNLRRTEAEKRGISAAPPGEGGDPKQGWGHEPGAVQWKPDKEKHDRQLLIDFGAKEGWLTLKRKPVAPNANLDVKRWVEHYVPEYGAVASKSLGRGRAAYEVGLDLTVGEAREQLAKISDAPIARRIADALQDTDAARTLREQAGETDPSRRVAAALAGHLRTLPARPPVTLAAFKNDLVVQRNLSFYSAMTGPSVTHPDSAWTMVRLDYIRSGMSAEASYIQFNGARTGALEHEWAHAIELLDPELKKRSIAFLVARTKKESAQKLSILLKNVDYGDDEVAKPDGFWHPYIGKVYVDKAGGMRATEVMSMGVEALFLGRMGPKDIGELAAKDFDHFLFVLGQLVGK